MDIKFRCSQLDKLMTNGRGKSPTMGLTAKGLVSEVFIRNNFAREKVFSSKETRKGIEQEETSFDLVCDVTGKLWTKNEANLVNDYITGTPDAFNDEIVIDIKTAWDIFSFHNKTMADALKSYEWQLRGYMMLLNTDKAQIVYTLVNSTEAQILEAKKRLYYSYDCDEENPDYMRDSEMTERLMKYDDIEPSKRIKAFEFERDAEKEQMLIDRVEEARKYYKTLKL